MQAFLFGLSILFTSFAHANSNSEYELGYQSAVNTREGSFYSNRPYLEFKNKFDKEIEGADSFFTLETAGRGWADFEDDTEFSLRALHLTYTSEFWISKVGFQEVAWGETFGIFIADLVNPRDYRDPLFNELTWQRVPVFSLNNQLVVDSWNLQTIVTPVPRNSIFPEKGSEFDLISSNLSYAPPPSFPLGEFGKEIELGARSGYLFDFGLDLTFFYLYHHNRNLAYQITSSEIIPIVEKTNSVGSAFSYAIDSFVFRGDTVLHFNYPTGSDLSGEIQRINRWHGIYGADLTTQDDWTLAGQYHLQADTSTNVHWLSLMARRPLVEQLLIAEAFVFKGLDNQDLWIQPQINLYPEDYLKISIRADLLDNTNQESDDGQLKLLRDKDRIFTWISYRI